MSDDVFTEILEDDPPSERPTPITDDTERKARIGHQSLTDGQWPWLAISEGWDHARNLERQLTESRENEAVMSRIASDCQCPSKDAEIAILHGKLAEARRERDNAISDWKQADTDSIRAIHERNEAREQRDQLAAQFTKLDKPKYSGLPMMDSVLGTPNPEFRAWVDSLPPTYWTRYDLSAARIGWEAALSFKMMQKGHEEKILA